MIAITVAIAAIALPPVRTVVEDRFTMLEVNHVVNEAGNPTFDQLIYWDWDRQRLAFICQGWQMMRDCRDTSDQGKHKQHDRYVDWFLQNLPADQKQYWRNRLTYKGEFTGGRLMPRRDYKTGEWVVCWNDDGLDRRIVAQQFRETWTKKDPERADQKRFPEKLRRSLTKPEDCR